MKWISTKDELPNHDDTVLCRFEGWDNMDELRTLSYDPPYKEWSDWNGTLHTKITHWMELPKPPKKI